MWCLAAIAVVTASGRRPQYRDVETQTDMVPGMYLMWCLAAIGLVITAPRRKQYVDMETQADTETQSSRAGGGLCCAVLTTIGMSFFVFALYMTVRDSF
jgi:hypothetical protein